MNNFSLPGGYRRNNSLTKQQLHGLLYGSSHDLPELPRDRPSLFQSTPPRGGRLSLCILLIRHDLYSIFRELPGRASPLHAPRFRVRR